MLGGVQSRTYYLAKYLKYYHHVEIVSFNIGKIEASFFTLFRRVSWGLNLAFFKKFPNKPDIIEASNLTTYLPAYFLGKRLNVPVVIWVPDVLQAKIWIKYFSFPVALVGLALEKICYTLPYAKIIALSDVTKNKLIEAGKSSENIVVIPAGVDLEEIKKIKYIKEKDRVICCIARLVAYKRVGDLIEAISIVKHDYPKIRCWIIGDGPEMNNLSKIIMKLNLDKNVFLLGSKSHREALSLLKRSKLFCLPSLVEGFGIVTIEAIACGIPYVNSDLPQNREATAGGKGGIFFSPKDSKDLADKLLLLIKDNKLYNKKIVEGRIIIGKFDWKNIAEQTINVYEKVMINYQMTSGLILE